MAGGEALVLTEDHGDLRSLRILGARAINLECALSSPVQGPWPPQAIAAGTDAFRSNARVRRIVLKAVDDGLADVRLWGDPRSASLGARPIRYRLSAAARAFKAHALSAAAVPTGDRVTAIETFATISEGDDA